MKSSIPEPDYDDPKELYAFFGLAFYNAALLEQGILNLAVAMEARGNDGVTVGDVDKLYESHDRDTFGRIIHKAKELFNFSTEIETDLIKALEYRNYLAHKFFVEHDTDLLTHEGRVKMIDELIKIMEHVKPLDEKMDGIWMNAWEPYGITPEWIENQLNAYAEHRRSKNA